MPQAETNIPQIWGQPEPVKTDPDDRPWVDGLVLLGRRFPAVATAIVSLACRSRRGSEGKVQLTGSYIATGASCALTTAYKARRSLSRLLGLRFGPYGWTALSERQERVARAAAWLLFSAGQVPELPEGLGPSGEAIRVYLPGGSTMRCPYHDDRNPSAWFTWNGREGHGGGICLSECCGERFALRRSGSGFVAYRATGLCGPPLLQVPGEDWVGATIECLSSPGGESEVWSEADAAWSPDEPGEMPRRGSYVNGTVCHGRKASRLPSFGFGSDNPRGRDRYAARVWGKSTGGIELVPNSIAPSRTESVGLCHPREIRWCIRQDGSQFPRPEGRVSYRTERIGIDIDGHAPQFGDFDPAKLEAIQRALPFDTVQVIRTSPTGTQIRCYLGRVCRASEVYSEEGKAELRRMGQIVLRILGWGGHVDESIWHPTSMFRRPGWRTLLKGEWAGYGWLVRLYGPEAPQTPSQTREPTPEAQRPAQTPQETSMAMTDDPRSLFQVMDPDEIRAAGLALRARGSVHPDLQAQAERITAALGCRPLITQKGRRLDWGMDQGRIGWRIKLTSEGIVYLSPRGRRSRRWLDVPEEIRAPIMARVAALSQPPSPATVEPPA